MFQKNIETNPLKYLKMDFHLEYKKYIIIDLYFITTQYIWNYVLVEDIDNWIWSYILIILYWNLQK